MKEYVVELGGVEHTMLLDDDDAKRYNAKPVEKKERAAAANKSRPAGESK